MAINGGLPPSDRWEPTHGMPNGHGGPGSQFYASTNSSYSNFEGIMRDRNYSTESYQLDARELSDAETIDLFHNAVYTAREEQALEGNDKLEAALRVKKLTLDFKKAGIKMLPDEVVDIIKRDVDMIVLSHNRISSLPATFSECASMTYLNLRGNEFDQFPQPLLKLEALQILDISRNKMEALPDDINRMKALRVLSVSNNLLIDLPLALGNMDSLKLLKMAGNPLNDSLKALLKAEEESAAASAMPVAEHESDTHLTLQVKKYLRTEAAALDSGGESSSESPMDTPKPLKRNTSLRFPVNVTGTADSRSPKPAVPTKSHFRIASGQSASGQLQPSRRPGPAPIATNNDRNRSNSESVLQAAQSSKSKRRGILPKKPQLGTLEESRVSRNSLHFRGTSHNSALKEKHQHLRTVSGAESNSSNDPDRAQGTFFRRLSSLPEHRVEAQSSGASIEGAKSLLFSLYSLHPYLSSLLHLANESGSKRSSLERIAYTSLIQLDALDQAIHAFTEDPKVDDRQRAQQARNIRRGCRACLVAYSQLGKLLTKNSRLLMVNADPRYIRMLLVLIYGSTIEAGNAFENLGNDSEKGQAPSQYRSQQAVPPARPSVPKLTVPPMFPPQERPATSRRLRPDGGSQSRIQHSPPQGPNGKHPSQSAVPLYVNGRSRSNSRASNFAPSTVPQTAQTPRSGDSFYIPPTPGLPLPDNHVTISQSDLAEDALFEKVFRSWQKFIGETYMVFIKVCEDFDRRQERAKLNNENKTRLGLWRQLSTHAREILEICRFQSRELASLNIYDQELRNSVDLWRKINGIGHTFADFCNNIRKATMDYRGEMTLMDTHKAITPCYKSFRLATMNLENSPWRYALADNPAGMNNLSAQPGWHASNGSAPSRLHGHHRTQGGSGSGSSPYIPTTPLSAALGPAAAATMPTMSGSSDFDKSFQGNVFQRAAYALNANPHPALRRA